MALRVKLLLVEDNSYDAEYIIEMLSDFKLIKLRAEHVKTLADARKCLSREKFDLIILDLNLPDSSGLATIFQLKSVAPDTGILVLTGSVGDELKADALKSGASGYLTKSEMMNSRLAVQIMSVLVDSQMKRHMPNPARELGSTG